MQELDLFAQKLNKLLPRLREVRREALEMAGDEMLDAVRGRIGGTGKVQRWQEKHMGSGGGYAAVRARAKTYDEAGDAVGKVTNAIEGGHRQQPGRYVPAIERRLTRDLVPGKYMYQRSQQDLDRIAREAAERIERDMVHLLEE